MDRVCVGTKSRSGYTTNRDDRCQEQGADEGQEDCILDGRGAVFVLNESFEHDRGFRGWFICFPILHSPCQQTIRQFYLIKDESFRVLDFRCCINATLLSGGHVADFHQTLKDQA